MSNFNQAILAAKSKRNFLLANRIDAERRMCRALIKEIVSLGYAVSIKDPEEFVIKKSTDIKKIMKVMFTSDEDVVVIHKIEKDAFTRVGAFYLVYDNDGWDVVNDHTDNDICNDIWQRVLQPLADKIQLGR